MNGFEYLKTVSRETHAKPLFCLRIVLRLFYNDKIIAKLLMLCQYIAIKKRPWIKSIALLISGNYRVYFFSKAF